MSCDYDDWLFTAILITGFNGLMCLGELTSPDSKKLRNCHKISHRSTVQWYPDAYSFLLPANKTDIAFKGNKIVIPASPDPSIDPLPIFTQYLQARDAQFPLLPSLWITSRGTVPIHSWFIKWLWKLFPNPNVAGQSMRAGEATALAEDSILLHIIQARGRWSSPAFNIYIRKNPVFIQALIAS